MFCKYCGKPIPQDSRVCSFCGTAVGRLASGNGFLDMLNSKWEKAGETPVGGASASQWHDPALERIASELQTETKIRNKQLRRISAAFIGLSTFTAVLCVLLVISLLRANSQKQILEQLREDYVLLSEKVNANVETLQAQLTDALMNQKEWMNNTEPPIDQTPALDAASQRDMLPSARIVQQPHDVPELHMGETVEVFSVVVDGQIKDFAWLKLDAAEGKWLRIQETDEKYRIENTETASSLVVISAAEEHKGSYLCQMEDQGAFRFCSDPVQIVSVVDAPDAPFMLDAEENGSIVAEAAADQAEVRRPLDNSHYGLEAD